MKDYEDETLDDEEETLDSLLEEAVEQGFEYALLQAQQINPEAQTFIRSYTEYYKSGRHEPPLELCTATATYVIRALANEPHQLYPATARWSNALSAGLALATPIVAASASIWYAAATLTGAGLSFLIRQFSRASSAREAAALQSRVLADPKILAPYIEDGRQLMGHQLFLYGALYEHQIRNFPQPTHLRQQTKRRR